MRLSILLSLASLSFGQSAHSTVPPRHTLATVNFYISTAGSDSNTCLTTSKCLTLTHVLSLIPIVLDNNYIINVADGTYAEAINTAGFIGGGAWAGGFTPSIQILGNTTTPTNVIFSGTTATCNNNLIAASYVVGACVQGTALVKLSGLKVTNAHIGIGCFDGAIELDRISIVMTGGAAAETIGFFAVPCKTIISGNVTVSGFDTDVSPAFGLGFYNGRGATVSHQAGTLTLTGPGTGASSDGTYALICENGCNYAIGGATAAITISQVQIGINLAANSSFSSFVGAGPTITMTNGSSTPTASAAVYINNSSTFDMIGGTISADHYTSCLSSNGNSEMASSGGTSATFTNCTAHATSNGGVIIGF